MDVIDIFEEHEFSNTNIHPKSEKNTPISWQTYGQFIASAGYFIIGLIAVSYLNTTHNNSIALLQNVLAIVGFGGFSINHLITGLDQNHIISSNEIHKNGLLYRLFRFVIQLSLVVYAVLMYTIDSHKYEMLIFKERLFNKPQISGISINIILFLFAHIFLCLVTAFGGNENIAFFALMLVFAKEFYNGNNDSIITSFARLSSLFLAIGYIMILF